MITTCFKSKIGILELIEHKRRIVSVRFVERLPNVRRRPSKFLTGVLKELKEYFSRRRSSFSSPFYQNGSSFQRRVWKELLKIPCGATITYKELARRIGHPRAVRAVGSAVGKNKIAILVPCHRLLGSGGRLSGYAYGVRRKKKLLDHEQTIINF